MSIDNQLNDSIFQATTERNASHSLEQLEAKVASLKTICDRLNPYAPIPEALKKDLRKLGFAELLDERYDPFALTNKLLLLMEDALEELERYKK